MPYEDVFIVPYVFVGIDPAGGGILRNVCQVRDVYAIMQRLNAELIHWAMTTTDPHVTFIYAPQPCELAHCFHKWVRAQVKRVQKQPWNRKGLVAQQRVHMERRLNKPRKLNRGTYHHQHCKALVGY
jgi:hypothetical protein